MSNVRLRRLQADYEKLRAFLAQQPRIRLIQAQGTPPERYQLEFQIKGLREVDEQLQTVANHMVEIALPRSYPRLPPQCRMLTPVFHPNIAPHAICIGDHWNAGEPLWSMVARIGEMIAYQSYNTKSPLNGEAARWVESNLDKLPLDKTNFMLDDVAPNGNAASHGEAPLAQAPRGPELLVAPVAAPPAMRPPPLPASPALPRAKPLAAAPPAVATAAPVAAPAPFALPPNLSPSLPSNPQPAAAPNTAAAANIVIQCGQCSSRYSVPANAAGKKVRCKKCQAILVIPAGPSPR